MSQRLRRWIRDESGTTSIEYGLIVALVACGLIATLGTVGGRLGSVFSAVAVGLGGTPDTAPPVANTNRFRG